MPLGYIGKLKRWEAREKLKALIADELGSQQGSERPDPKTTFGWFVENRYLPMREGRWHQATTDKTTYEINRYLGEYFQARPLGEVTQFELQVHLNKLAQDFSDSIVSHFFSNLKAVFRAARKMKFIVEDPAEDLMMPDTSGRKILSGFALFCTTEETGEKSRGKQDEAKNRGSARRSSAV